VALSRKCSTGCVWHAFRLAGNGLRATAVALRPIRDRAEQRTSQVSEPLRDWVGDPKDSVLDPRNISVDDLLDAVAHGDRSAFDHLYGRLLSPVSRLTRLLMRDVALAEEVTQEVFLAVWLGAERFDPVRGDGAAWIIGIARSRAIDRIRAVHSARLRDRNYAALSMVPAPSADDVVARLDHRILHEALWVLTPKQRQSVMLAFFGGHSYQEVSTLLGVPLPTVKSRIRDGLLRLRSHLEASGQSLTSGLA
jgi:RNA polymerase sigma-70 factor (ECF subfamily)